MAVNIMIQGTMSNAGKSLITAGLCRVFTQDGYRVAPFKSQNMALNSYITVEGLEMGRAQVVQAEACKKEASVLMNPVLLKPTTDTGSQVIVNGVVRKNMSALDYFKYKKKLIPDIMKAYRTLEAENDIIVIEGAGSPAEINLKSDDIVNMGLAELVDAPVLLVGDIDRGGVFAQLAGTVMLLEEHEKKRIRALVINKFRGDISILEPGLRMIENICGKPVAGVIPYADVDIDDEDSLTSRFEKKFSDEKIHVAVVKLPRISNFSDFMPLEAASGVAVTYAVSEMELKDADLIIIPGTKSTVSDLEWMKKNGLASEIIKASRRGVPIVGICGGYQILGEWITDNCGLESGKMTRTAGLGLLPVCTEFFGEKETVQTRVRVPKSDGFFGRLSDLEVSGYEIHMGRNSENQDKITVEGNVFGTYLHGIFDNSEFSKCLLGLLADLKGLEGEDFSVPDMAEYRESQYEKLADIIRNGLDMDMIYRIMGLRQTGQK